MLLERFEQNQKSPLFQGSCFQGLGFQQLVLPLKGQPKNQQRDQLTTADQEQGKLETKVALEQLDEFLASIEKRAFSIARVAVSHDADALDIVQDAMMKLVENYRDKPADQWRPLFYRILQNRIMDFHRGAKKRWLFVANEPAANDDDQDIGFAETIAITEESPSSLLAAEQLGANILAAIEQLPLRQQQCFLLRGWEGLSVKETASAMQLNEGSVKVHYSRAMAKLKAVLEEYGKAHSQI